MLKLSKKFRVLYWDPKQSSLAVDQLLQLNVVEEPKLRYRYSNLKLLAALLDERGLPIESATLFLAKHSLQSRGATGATTRTYAESLLCWFRYLSDLGLSHQEATEEHLQLYRAMLHKSTDSSFCKRWATATANLRTTVAAEFHRWCQINDFQSELGRFLLENLDYKKSIRGRIIKRHPRSLSIDELNQIFIVAKNPYKLIFKWALVTGMRRFEILNLRVNDLPTPEELLLQDDGIARLNIMRKGGKESTVYVPVSLIEETRWFIFVQSEKHNPNSFVFHKKTGESFSASLVSREFKRCANRVGIKATLHYLRHTFAVYVLSKISQKEGINALKTVQVLLGHSSSKTTEIYCDSLRITEPDVVSALNFLYGASL